MTVRSRTADDGQAVAYGEDGYGDVLDLVVLAEERAPAPETVTYSRAPKRSDALQLITATASVLADALNDVDFPAGAEWRRARIAHGGLIHALDQLALSRGRTPGVNGRRAPGPRTELDARGYRRAPATQPGAGKGKRPASYGVKYEKDPPPIIEIISMLHACADTPEGHRLFASIIFAWRTAARSAEQRSVIETDLNERANSILIRRGKGDKTRTIGMDPFGWEMLAPWFKERREYPPGPLFCVLNGPTAGRGWSAPEYRRGLNKVAAKAGVRRRIHPHGFRHAWALEALREGIPLPIIQRQLGHSNLAVTTVYLAGLSNDEVVGHAVARRPPALSIPELMAAPDLMEIFRAG